MHASWPHQDPPSLKTIQFLYLLSAFHFHVGPFDSTPDWITVDKIYYIRVVMSSAFENTTIVLLPDIIDRRYMLFLALNTWYSIDTCTLCHGMCYGLRFTIDFINQLVTKQLSATSILACQGCCIDWNNEDARICEHKHLMGWRKKIHTIPVCMIETMLISEILLSVTWF